MGTKNRWFAALAISMMVSGTAWAQQGADASVYVTPPGFARVQPVAASSATFEGSVRACFASCPQAANVCTDGAAMTACLRSQAPACTTLRAGNARAMTFMSTICGNAGFVQAANTTTNVPQTPSPRRDPTDLCRRGRRGSPDAECVRCVSRGRGWAYADGPLSDGALAIQRAGASEFDTRCVFRLAAPLLPVVGAIAQQGERAISATGVNAVALAELLRGMRSAHAESRYHDLALRAHVCWLESRQLQRAAPSERGSSDRNPFTVLWSASDRELEFGSRPTRGAVPTPVAAPARTPAQIVDPEHMCDFVQGELDEVRRSLSGAPPTRVLSLGNEVIDDVARLCASGGSVECQAAQQRLVTELQRVTTQAPVVSAAPVTTP